MFLSYRNTLLHLRRLHDQTCYPDTNVKISRMGDSLVILTSAVQAILHLPKFCTVNGKFDTTAPSVTQVITFCCTNRFVKCNCFEPSGREPWSDWCFYAGKLNGIIVINYYINYCFTLLLTGDTQTQNSKLQLISPHLSTSFQIPMASSSFKNWSWNSAMLKEATKLFSILFLTL